MFLQLYRYLWFCEIFYTTSSSIRFTHCQQLLWYLPSTITKTTLIDQINSFSGYHYWEIKSSFVFLFLLKNFICCCYYYYLLFYEEINAKKCMILISRVLLAHFLTVWMNVAIFFIYIYMTYFVFLLSPRLKIGTKRKWETRKW